MIIQNWGTEGKRAEPEMGYIEILENLDGSMLENHIIYPTKMNQ